MSMLIIGVNPPKSCYACSWYNKVECPVNNGRYYYRVQRHPACPLVEIPTPHGRLGDLDALYEEISNGNKPYNGIDGYDGEYQHIGNVDDCMDVIKMADAVIEAEGSEE